MPPAGKPSRPTPFTAVPPLPFLFTALQVMKALLAAKEAADAASWQAFQAEVLKLKLQRTRAEREAQEVRTEDWGGGGALRGGGSTRGYQAQATAHSVREGGAGGQD